MKFEHNNQTYELIMLHLAGSKLYGNSTPESDTDYRGVFIAPPETKLGLLNKVEQLEGKDIYKSLIKAGLNLEETDDILIYELNRFAQLASENNPNIMDSLCLDYNKEFTIYINEKGKELIDNKSLFLSSKLKFTFSGYAISQLNKIRNRDKYLTRYPRISEVLDAIKEYYDNKLIDFNWICDNFGGHVADFVTNESPQNNIKLESRIAWDVFKDTYNKGLTILGKEEIDFDRYRIPRLIDYCNARNLKGKSYKLSERYDFCDGEYLSYFLHHSAAFRTFSPSMLAIYKEGNGIFSQEGKLKANDSEHIGDFVCLLSIDQNNYKAEKDFNAAMWEWKCKRNEKRSALEAEFGIDLKNLSHLWRLMTKAKEILKTGAYNPTLYGEDLRILRGIRDGSLYGRESYNFALKFAEDNDKELDELYKTTKLQKKPDIKKINNLVLKLQGY